MVQFSVRVLPDVILHYLKALTIIVAVDVHWQTIQFHFNTILTYSNCISMALDHIGTMACLFTPFWNSLTFVPGIHVMTGMCYQIFDVHNYKLKELNSNWEDSFNSFLIYRYLNWYFRYWTHGANTVIGNIYSPTPVETIDHSNTSRGDRTNITSSDENNSNNNNAVVNSRSSYRSRSLR